jgi:Cobalamin biosynthesis protein CobD/CbiB
VSLAQLFPYSVWECWWLAPLALIFDLWLGDPDLPWRHPVCVVGKLLDWLEAPARRVMRKNGPDAERQRGRFAGGVALAVLVGLTGVAAWGLVSLPVLGPLLALYLAWAGLALGSLLRTGQEVLRRVEHYDEPQAREALSWLVSRDTSSMDRLLMRKTLADTLSENLTDAFMAPFFWLLVGGPVAMWCYKAVSTTDSMWGYVTEKWRWLGWAGARGDDALAYLPARLSACRGLPCGQMRSHLRAASAVFARSAAARARVARPLARFSGCGPTGRRYAKPQFRLVHDSLRMAVRRAHGRAVRVLRHADAKTLARAGTRRGRALGSQALAGAL